MGELSTSYLCSEIGGLAPMCRKPRPSIYRRLGLPVPWEGPGGDAHRTVESGQVLLDRGAHADVLEWLWYMVGARRPGRAGGACTRVDVMACTCALCQAAPANEHLHLLTAHTPSVPRTRTMRTGRRSCTATRTRLRSRSRWPARAGSLRRWVHTGGWTTSWHAHALLTGFELQSHWHALSYGALGHRSRCMPDRRWAM